MNILWYRAYPSVNNYHILYNIYFSTIESELFDAPRYLSTNNGGLYALIKDLIPGDVYFVAVRGAQYDLNWYDPTELISADGYLYIYPETLLSTDITATDTLIPIEDIGIFPDHGVITVGAEWIRYTSKSGSNLVASDRGFLGTNPRMHNVDGYDGYHTWSPIIKFFYGLEDNNKFYVQETSTFQGYEIFTVADGYKERNSVGILTTDLSASDAERVDFRRFDYSGWHRTDPKLLFQGKCLDTYIGGEWFCADGYLGVGRQVRNIPLSEHADMREEMLIENTGEECVLVQRLWKGVVCSCYEPAREIPDDRCPRCYGTGFITGYEQYFNPRISSGRILVRFGPYTDDLKQEDAGMEMDVTHDCWTLTVPTLKDRDFIIRFNIDGTEEFRYEILDVTRNKLFYGQSGKQNFKARRVRKTDPIYMWRVFRNTQFFPSDLTTSVGAIQGPGLVPIPHTHNIRLSESITSLSQINQTTHGTSAGPEHSHAIVNGVITPSLQHSHQIILP